MPIEWDETKRAANVTRHGADFALVERLEWGTALVRADTRFDYGEVRLVAIGLIATVMHVAVFTVERRAVRVISLRPANRKEVLRYAQEQAP